MADCRSRFSHYIGFIFLSGLSVLTWRAGAAF
jgi:hypothetical protein